MVKVYVKFIIFGDIIVFYSMVNGDNVFFMGNFNEVKFLFIYNYNWLFVNDFFVWCYFFDVI